MTSGSYWSPTSSFFTGDANNPYMTTSDRNFALTAGTSSEPLLSSATTSGTLAQSTYKAPNRLSSIGYYPTSDGSATPTFSLIPATYTDPSLSVDQQQLALANLYASQQTSNQGQYSAPNSQSEDTSNYYMSYLPYQPAQPQQQSYGQYISGEPSNLGPMVAGGDEMGAQQSGTSRIMLANGLTSLANDNQYQMRAQRPSSNSFPLDQIMSSASSIEAPIYAGTLPKIYIPIPNRQSQARRSGPIVSIKLDESTRNRLQQQLNAMQEQSVQRHGKQTSSNAAHLGQPTRGASSTTTTNYSNPLLETRAQAPIVSKEKQTQQASAQTQPVDQAPESMVNSKWTPTRKLEEDDMMQQQSVPAVMQNSKWTSSRGEQQGLHGRTTYPEKDSDQKGVAVQPEGIQPSPETGEQNKQTYLIIRPKTSGAMPGIMINPTEQLQPIKSNSEPAVGASVENDQEEYLPSASNSTSSGGWRSISSPNDQLGSIVSSE